MTDTKPALTATEAADSLRTLAAVEQSPHTRAVFRMAEAALRAFAQPPAGWMERNVSFDAWFFAYSHNPKADTKPLYYAPQTGKEQ